MMQHQPLIGNNNNRANESAFEPFEMASMQAYNRSGFASFSQTWAIAAQTSWDQCLAIYGTFSLNILSEASFASVVIDRNYQAVMHALCAASVK
jgi:hypothetical protein